MIKLDIEWQTPLWKIKISEEDYFALKQCLIDGLKSNRGLHDITLQKYAALYHALWWQKEYNGGIPAKESITQSLGLETQTDELYKLAKKGLLKLNIDIIHGNVNTLWFRTMLVQGGLPINAIRTERDGLSTFKEFLRKLVSHCSFYEINWNDSSFIQQLPFTYRLPRSFQNEGIFELSLQIARAINENDDYLLPYNVNEGDWNTLTQELKAIKQHGKRSTAPIIVKWKIANKEGYLKLYFDIELAKIISEDYLITKGIRECNSFILVVKNKPIATYDKNTNGSFVLRQNINKTFEWEEEPAVIITLKTDSNQLLDIAIPNNSAPNFDNPILLEESDQFWYLKTRTSDTCNNVVIFNDNWIINDVENPILEHFSVSENFHSWYQFKDKIILKNVISNECITFDKNDSLYNCEFDNFNPDWMHETNFRILQNSPKIRVYDEEGNIVYNNKIIIEYRETDNKIWLKYDPKCIIPFGRIEFKITFPDKKYIINKFFSTGKIFCELNCITNSLGSIKFNLHDGLRLNIISDQRGILIKDIGNNNFEIERISENNFFPTLVEFHLIKGNSILKFNTITPFKGIVIIDPKGIESNHIKISREQIYGYKLFVMGEKVVAKISHSDSPKTINESLQPGIYYLTQFEASIDKLQLLHGLNPFNSIPVFIRIEVVGTSSSKRMDIKGFELYAEKERNESIVKIYDDSAKCYDFPDDLYGIPIECNSEEIIVKKLERNNDGFIISNNTALKKFVLVSKKDAHKRIIPTLLFSGICKENEESSTNNSHLDADCKDEIETSTKGTDISKENNLYATDFENIKNILIDLPIIDSELKITEEWKKIAKYFHYVIEYNLPFRRFNYFRIIAKSPKLMVKLLLVLWYDSKINQDDMLQYLLKFECEMAVAFHWISDMYWNDCIEEFLVQIEQKGIEILAAHYQKLIVQKKDMLINYTLNSDNAANLLRQINKKNTPTPPDKIYISNVRQRINNENSLIASRISVSEKWKNSKLFPALFELGNNTVYKYNEIKTLFLAPLKAALAYSGEEIELETSIWSCPKEIRRAILFYRQYTPQLYLEIFECMVKRIIFLNNQTVN